MRSTPYLMIGGEDGVRQLVETFYDIVEQSADGAPLMAMHNRGNGLAHARQAQFEFLSGFLGGPQLYVEHHGHSNVRQMHAHLKITPIERDSWLHCMEKALAICAADAPTRRSLFGHFARVAGVLTNAA